MELLLGVLMAVMLGAFYAIRVSGRGGAYDRQARHDEEMWLSDENSAASGSSTMSRTGTANRLAHDDRESQKPALPAGVYIALICVVLFVCAGITIAAGMDEEARGRDISGPTLLCIALAFGLALALFFDNSSHRQGRRRRVHRTQPPGDTYGNSPEELDLTNHGWRERNTRHRKRRHRHPR
jgi:hypothetical protein